MMKIKAVASIALLIVLLFLLASDVLAISSTNYALNWYMPFTGTGGSQFHSTNYKVDLTLGQTAVGALQSSSYRVGLGYWYGALSGGRLNLPLIMR